MPLLLMSKKDTFVSPTKTKVVIWRSYGSFVLIIFKASLKKNVNCKCVKITYNDALRKKIRTLLFLKVLQLKKQKLFYFFPLRSFEGVKTKLPLRRISIIKDYLVNYSGSAGSGQMIFLSTKKLSPVFLYNLTNLSHELYLF